MASEAAKSVGDGSDAFEINLTPMIDVVFQLIIFFMCAMKFKTLAMKLEMDLPKGAGMSVEPMTRKELTSVRVQIDQTDEEGVPHIRVFGEEIRPDLGREDGAGL